MEIFKEIARLKFPGYQVTGDGRIAVVLVCCAKIVLCELPMAAEPIRASACEQCQRSFGDNEIHHKVVVLSKPVEIYNGPRAVPRNRIWERDRREVNA